MKLTPLIVAIFALLSSLPACSGQSDAAQAQGQNRGRIVDSSAGTVALGITSRTAYRPGAAAGGALAGTITLQGAAADSVVAVGKDANYCGDSATVRDVDSPANSLVWIDDIATGKPFPDVRRETLTIEKCRFEPRVMAVVKKSTINIFSRDKVGHGPKFYREGAGEPIESVHTVDAGQVVPSEKIAAEPGIVEVRCDEHPFARGYIAVFDHPYFAVTDEKGAFRIDGLPQGTYNVKVWHEGMERPAVQRVAVGPTGEARLDATLALK